MIAAVAAGQFETALYLIEQEVDVNVTSKTGVTALLYAVGHDNQECIEKLLEAGADPNIHSGQNDSALMVATRRVTYRSSVCFLIMELNLHQSISE
ncbi:ankyrin repeat domain-containing protein [Ammoniphilus resinae]|uniref:Ankyrin repeat protein n=1 Tax=Ammoniphilus resinae TaxID=861532 RepID=A0ABS4GNN1_9BACL|nr:ankyrin repeat domain-containing protein [Ammoniphilus resinae]MBP1931873.1 ankyrin repeat protein [Ammoniphilus resinae]